MTTEVTVTRFPRSSMVLLIKLIRDAACIDLLSAKHLVEKKLPITFPMLDVRYHSAWLEELVSLSVEFTVKETDALALEERRVKAMVEADDNQTSYERCRHMLRAALKES